MNQLKSKVLNKYLDSADTIAQAVEQAELDANYSQILFPNGMVDLIEFYNNQADEQMVKAIEKDKDFAKLGTTAKVAHVIKTRLQQQAKYKSKIQGMFKYLLNPLHAATALKLKYNTMDAIWKLAGDASNDYNFYTKRGLLGIVYMRTINFWFNDNSKDNQDTWAYLDKRLDEVVSVGKNISSLKAKFIP